ncbi:polyprenol reductase 2-like [Cynara cardunculus var. scolymus]|uniref:polyprenol reductase 2-like n=1 Tax=Cynara cardunculus var. scolymus TaxID=59895 RepID=UPI000D629948|nr:polyprenol reductase 2-like [Cynara cardunculus var. scolymus]
MIMSEIMYLRMEELGLGLVSLLRAAWIAATLPILLACLPLPGLGWFRRALLGFAKRGKILPSNSTKLTVPQRFFSHFYVVAIFWTTILLVAVWFYALKMLPSLIEHDLFSTITSHLTGGSHAFSWHKSLSTREHVYNVWLSVFLLLLMEVQVLRRFYETIYVFNYSSSARMHIFGYLAGLFFYTAAPLSLCCTFAPEVFDFVKNLVAEFIVKGKDRMSKPEFNIWMFVTPFLRLRWYAWIGAAIFLWGWVHQLRCHEILGSLREKTETLEEYVIPYGDWFEYVSSPHYSAEIVIYGGLLVASGGADLSLWLLFTFVVANLVFAATETQRWYHHKFDDYPRNRYAIFPFVY